MSVGFSNVDAGRSPAEYLVGKTIADPLSKTLTSRSISVLANAIRDCAGAGRNGFQENTVR
jgi:hypothetical protein